MYWIYIRHFDDGKNNVLSCLFHTAVLTQRILIYRLVSTYYSNLPKTVWNVTNIIITTCKINSMAKMLMGFFIVFFFSDMVVVLF